MSRTLPAITHEVVAGGFCRVCGETSEWINLTDAQYVEVEQ